MRYLASLECADSERLPALTDLSERLGISVASLREQLEVARALGLVEVRPRTGIRRLPFTFTQACLRSLSYAIAVDRSNFQTYSDFRNHIETAYWYQAVSRLTEQDHQELHRLISRAMEKLQGTPIQIPHQEHRELHMSIYRRLNNPFVLGALDAYWEAYEAVGLNVYTDYQYLQKVWQYHQKMVEAISNGNFDVGYQALVEHIDLLSQRSQPIPSQKFE